VIFVNYTFIKNMVMVLLVCTESLLRNGSAENPNTLGCPWLWLNMGQLHVTWHYAVCWHSPLDGWSGVIIYVVTSRGMDWWVAQLTMLQQGQWR